MYSREIGSIRNIDTINTTFKPGQIDEALEYIVSIMLNNDEGIEFIDIPAGLPDLKQEILRSFICNIYGEPNLVNMANFKKVENEWLIKYRPLVLEYLEHAKANSHYIEIIPEAIAFKIINHRAKQPGFKPFRGWSPRQEWKYIFCNDKDRNLISPFNRLVHAKIAFSSKLDRLMTHLKSNFIDFEASLDLENNISKIAVDVLPDDNFNKILKLMDIIDEIF